MPKKYVVTTIDIFPSSQVLYVIYIGGSLGGFSDALVVCRCERAVAKKINNMMGVPARPAVVCSRLSTSANRKEVMPMGKTS